MPYEVQWMQRPLPPLPLGEPGKEYELDVLKHLQTKWGRPEGPLLVLPAAVLKRPHMRALVFTDATGVGAPTLRELQDELHFDKPVSGDVPGIDAVVLQRKWLYYNDELSDYDVLDRLRETLVLVEVKTNCAVGPPQVGGSAVMQSYLLRAKVQRRWALVSPDRVMPMLEHAPCEILGRKTAENVRGFFDDHYVVQPSTEVVELQQLISKAALPVAKLYSAARDAIHAYDVLEATDDGTGLDVAMEDLRGVIKNYHDAHSRAKDAVEAGRKRRRAALETVLEAEDGAEVEADPARGGKKKG